MPGLFGTFNAPPVSADILRADILQILPDARIQEHGCGFIGDHRFDQRDVPSTSQAGHFVAVDGEWALYQAARRALPNNPEELYYFDRHDGGLRTPCVGTIAVVDPKASSVLIATDPSGAFPTYYCEFQGGLLYSSLLRPLAHAIGAAPDRIAVLEFLRQAYTVGDKTLFQGIRRLLPGQAVIYSAGNLIVLDQSTAWSGTNAMTRLEAADLAWSRLEDSVTRSVPMRGSTLMMSGGWDSRTLLGVAAARNLSVGCYSHGDTASRELDLVKELSSEVGCECQLEQIDDRVLDLELLQAGFNRTENVVFPHWNRSGHILASSGTACAVAGVFGEILGGHYGPPMLMSSPAARSASVASLLLLGKHVTANNIGSVAARDVLLLGDLSHHWYLQRDYEASLIEARARMNEAVEASIARLERRGVIQPDAIIEAFISEHRGAQYINAQLRSIRAWTDVAAPFAGGEIFTFATRIPISAKIHNSLSRRMLARRAPNLLNYPMAATLVPARAPILVQEASRAARKALEKITRSNGRRNLGWVNFEFLRGSGKLQHLIEDLRSDIWHKQRMYSTVDRAERNTSTELHPMFDQMCKILSVDLMLR